MQQIEAATNFSFSQNITVPNFAQRLQLILGSTVNITAYLDQFIGTFYINFNILFITILFLCIFVFCLLIFGNVGPGSFDLRTNTLYPSKIFIFMFDNIQQSFVINTTFTGNISYIL